MLGILSSQLQQLPYGEVAVLKFQKIGNFPRRLFFYNPMNTNEDHLSSDAYWHSRHAHDGGHDGKARQAPREYHPKHKNVWRDPVLAESTAVVRAWSLNDDRLWWVEGEDGVVMNLAKALAEGLVECLNSSC